MRHLAGAHVGQRRRHRHLDVAEAPRRAVGGVEEDARLHDGARRRGPLADGGALHARGELREHGVHLAALQPREEHARRAQARRRREAHPALPGLQHHERARRRGSGLRPPALRRLVEDLELRERVLRDVVGHAAHLVLLGEGNLEAEGHLPLVLLRRDAGHDDYVGHGRGVLVAVGHDHVHLLRLRLQQADGEVGVRAGRDLVDLHLEELVVGVAQRRRVRGRRRGLLELLLRRLLLHDLRVRVIGLG
mmetsp:Transcript_41844/g.131144  ORF Transcript_41844/g.131144 Transcript_41844/m.131144 type:complete len:249 (-) Transcript_41844:599-1345(-)